MKLSEALNNAYVEQDLIMLEKIYLYLRHEKCYKYSKIKRVFVYILGVEPHKIDGLFETMNFERF